MAEAPKHTAYSSKPWLQLYAPGLPATIDPPIKDGLSLFRAAAQTAPDQPAIFFFDGEIKYRELDVLSDALAAALVEGGFQPGDRLALYLQNMPAFHIATLAAWKAGGIATTINPMNRQRELELIFADSQPKAIICLDQLYHEVVAKLPTEIARPPMVTLVAPRDFQTRDDPRIFGAAPAAHRSPDDPKYLSEICESFRGRKPPTEARPNSDDAAFLVYTSGTTGAPKAAVNTHGNVAFNGQSIPRQYSLEKGDAIFAFAPMFHITGIISNILLPWALAAPVIMTYRFEPGVALDLIAERRPAWTVAAITAFIAMLNNENCVAERFASFKAVVSGGAPVPPSVVDEFERRTGRRLNNGYGLTETSAGVISGPHGRRAPVDPESGALAIGVPVFNVEAWIADENGKPAGIGETGEIVVIGPSVSPGYWRKPEETKASMRDDGFHTGDIGFMDAEGWFYLVDRKKDMIIASGFKVWPREVEDVIYGHPAVREVAVVGVPDPYRGETVKAFVSLKAGAEATVQDLLDWCRPRMATYKRPHAIELVDELPKTLTGKILRRMLKG